MASLSCFAISSTPRLKVRVRFENCYFLFVFFTRCAPDANVRARIIAINDVICARWLMREYARGRHTCVVGVLRAGCCMRGGLNLKTEFAAHSHFAVLVI